MKLQLLRAFAFLSLAWLGGCSLPDLKPEESDYIVRGSKISGVYDGPFEIWSPTVRQASGQFHGGKAVGHWTFWDSKGVKVASLDYADGVQNGDIQMWYGSSAYETEVGNPKLHGTLKGGQWDGKVVTYYPSGPKRTERTYKDGLLLESATFDLGGKLLPVADERQQAEQEDKADANDLNSLDRMIRNSVLYARPG